MVVLDAMEKTANVRVVQTELNDAPGVCIKLAGRIGDIQSAAHAAEAAAQAMQVPILAHVIPQQAGYGKALSICQLDRGGNPPRGQTGYDIPL